MRSIRLARIAAEAEILLLRRMAATAARRAMFGAVAAVFALAVLVLLHVIGVLAMQRYAGFNTLAATAIVLGVDLLFAILFGVLATGAMADPVATEARLLRDQSLEQARQSLTLAAMLAPATRLVAQTGLIRVLMRALGAGLRRSRA